MDEKLKAKVLIEGFLPYVDENDLLNDFSNKEWRFRNAKQCALIMVEELINSTRDFYMPHQKISTRKTFQREYWVKVKEAIINYENES